MSCVTRVKNTESISCKRFMTCQVNISSNMTVVVMCNTNERSTLNCQLSNRQLGSKTMYSTLYYCKMVMRCSLKELCYINKENQPIKNKTTFKIFIKNLKLYKCQNLEYIILTYKLRI